MDYIKRMVNEYKELQEKSGSLDAFIGGSVYQGLSEAQQTLMQEQLDAMDKYSQALLARINLEEG